MTWPHAEMEKDLYRRALGVGTAWVVALRFLPGFIKPPKVGDRVQISQLWGAVAIYEVDRVERPVGHRGLRAPGCVLVRPVEWRDAGGGVYSSSEFADLLCKAGASEASVSLWSGETRNRMSMDEFAELRGDPKPEQILRLSLVQLRGLNHGEVTVFDASSAEDLFDLLGDEVKDLCGSMRDYLELGAAVERVCEGGVEDCLNVDPEESAAVRFDRITDGFFNRSLGQIFDGTWEAHAYVGPEDGRDGVVGRSPSEAEAVALFHAKLLARLDELGWLSL